MEQINNKNAGAVVRKVEYADFDLAFRSLPLSRDLAMKREADSVRQSALNILLTNANEVPFLPDFGGNIIAYMFESFDIVTATILEEQIRSTLNTYEPRLRIINITVSDHSDRNELRVRIEAELITSRTLITPIEFTVERQR